MDYQKIYNCLVSKTHINDNRVYEMHHILPRAMGGSDHKSNLVRLTPKEHFLAHLLLWRIYRNRQTASALWFMKHSKRYEKSRTGRTYEKFVIEYNKLKKGSVPYNKDLNIYKFKNIFTNEIFSGTRCEFDLKFNGLLGSYKSHNIIDGRTDNGWRLESNNSKLPIDKTMVYSLSNIDTGEVYIGKQSEFCKKYKIKNSCLSTNKTQTVKGWRLDNIETPKYALQDS